GLSLNQLNQINVPPVHEKGFTGSGVTLAIFDTGFRKSHDAFATHYVEGRVLAEWDFIFNDDNTANEGADWSNQWNHGTYIWSTSGGLDDGTLYGPAYRSNFILCKTEDVRSETQVEEDNWVAALEWVDSLGADVVTSSLSYMGWDDGTGYTPADLDGWTAVTSIAASMAADMGIVVCNSAGNSGPSPQTLGAPADAFDILTVGAVDASGFLASFSSRGPTADLRIKPEVTAQGVSTSCAVATSDASYGTKSGTSLSTPLVAGAACLLIEARPYYTPRQIRWALMETANNAVTPNNDVGWGLIDLDAALSWGAHFGSDITVGNAPATVQFYDSSTVTPTSWTWDFGDGDSSSVQNPSHFYDNPGAYDVTLSIGTDSMGTITDVKEGYIILLADTLSFEATTGTPGSQVVMSVNLKNSQELSKLVIPLTFDDSPFLTFDSATLGQRTLYFERFQLVGFIPSSNSYAYELQADDGGGRPPLAAGDGEIMQLHFSIDALAPLGTTIVVDTTSSPKVLE
ncbi:MAG: S8 family serine peptidase, partial [candidate division Zixibacteria bacterium]|nr:S8 family serine peptidase [candidate division Zixibacteria bacterium]